ncbi:MAG: hypothetical protein WC137_02415 [Alphaproteobacteria bacterium]
MTPNKNILTRGLKLALLTIMFGFMTTGKTSAQQNQNDTLGAEKTILNRQDSAYVTAICSPDLYKDLMKLSNLRDTLIYILEECKQAMDLILQKNGKYTSDDMQQLKEDAALSEKVMKDILDTDAAISGLLGYCFDKFIVDPKSLKIFPVKNKNAIIIQGTVITIDEETFFVAPENILARKAIWECQGSQK